MTPAGHLFSGYLVGEWAAAGEERRWRIIAAAVVGSIVPDLDVALGLLGGWAGATAHRGATHSFLGAVALAWVIAALFRRPRRALFVAALGGILTHIFWDWLNPWGVVPFWPWLKSFRGNLLHEGDLYAAAILLLACILVWKKQRLLAAAALATLLPAYLLTQLWWRDLARALARAELAGRQTAVFPTNKLTCGWIVLSAGDADMSVHCVRSPAAAHLEPAFDVTLRSDSFTQASEQSELVRDFRQKIPFSFAEVQPAEDAGAVVVWRDLRVAFEEKPSKLPTGIYVRLDPAGKILSERHRWWLSLW